MAHAHRDIVVIGASAGGVQALQTLVSRLPADLPAAVFIVLHLWPGSQSYLASILSRAGPLPAVDAQHGAPIRRGEICIAPTDRHLLVEADRVLVVRGPRENRFRPAINPLFRSAAAAFRQRVIGVVLTGMLDDGAAGLWAIKQCGGTTVIQSDAEFDQMPNAAAENVEIDYQVTLADLPALLNRLTREPLPAVPAPEVPEVVRINNEGAKMANVGFRLDQIARRSIFTCPECHGPLWEVEEGKQLHFRCHVGHAYSGDALDAAQSTIIEQSLWTAIRALKESAVLDTGLAERARQSGLPSSALEHEANAANKLKEAENIQVFLAQLRPNA